MERNSKLASTLSQSQAALCLQVGQGATLINLSCAVAKDGLNRQPPALKNQSRYNKSLPIIIDVKQDD